MELECKSIFLSYRNESFKTAAVNIVNQGMDSDISAPGGVNMNYQVVDNMFVEESNLEMLSHLSVFLMNSSIFLVQSIHLSMAASDVMCGRVSNLALVAIPLNFIGSTISYSLLFLAFTCLHEFIYYWNRVSFFLGMFNITVTLNPFNCRRKKKQSLEAMGDMIDEKIPEDEEAKRYLATKSHKNMVKKLGKCSNNSL